MEYNFLQILILILIGLMFFKENLLKWVGRYFGFKNGNTVETKVDKLTTHYNHEITQILNNILSEQRGIGRKMDTSITKLDEIIKYGVKELK